MKPTPREPKNEDANRNVNAKVTKRELRRPRPRGPKKGGTISLRTTAILLTIGFELLRIVERNHDVVKILLNAVMVAPDKALPEISDIVGNLDDETLSRLRVETRSSAEAVITLTSRLFMFDELLQNLTPTGVISVWYAALRELFFQNRKPKPSENDLIFTWVFAIAQHFPLVRSQLEFVTRGGEAKVAKWKLDQRELALAEFRKMRSNIPRVRRIEADIRDYIAKFFLEN